MTTFTAYILTAFALVFVIEGLLYALFPDQIRKMMALAITLPPKNLRIFGCAMVLTGFGLVMLISRF